MFRPDMIKAIQEGRKTVTRRLDHLKEINLEPNKWLCPPIYDYGYETWAFFQPNSKATWVKPRYQVGEVVYIKEAWATENQYNDLKPSEIPHTAKIFYLLDGNYDPFKMGRICSPLFMMEWMARDFIKFTDVRPERLQEITWQDCVREGIHAPDHEFELLIGNYQTLWDSINPEYPWASNPWVWRYEFKRVKK